ncbi:hypothetical protein K7432_005582 [Basidiobolus ranarum]|uniref:Uncharacterized protein n=1 Tax=Basidiobolus ranarum TaxID=34480 RepID=A0ABR2WW85_9FUNG
MLTWISQVLRRTANNTTPTSKTAALAATTLAKPTSAYSSIDDKQEVVDTLLIL